MISIDLSKQPPLDADPKAIHQIKFTGNLGKNKTIFFILEEVKETSLGFFTRNFDRIVTFLLFQYNINIK